MRAALGAVSVQGLSVAVSGLEAQISSTKHSAIKSTRRRRTSGTHEPVDANEAFPLQACFEFFGKPKLGASK